MATIPKEITAGKDKHHIPAMLIRGAQINEETMTAYVSFAPMAATGNDAPTNLSTTLACTREAYRRISKGIGSLLRPLRNGLIGLSRFNYIMVTEEVVAENGEKQQTVTHVHAHPNQNYVSADFTEELRFPVDSNEAIVQLHKSGDIDVMAFPSEFYLSIRRFIGELEKLDKVDEDTTVTFKTQGGDVEARIIMINGNMVRFSLDVSRR